MAFKQITFKEQAREKVFRGATKLADAVRVTLGPRSKCVLISKQWGKPLICNDGVTIAREIEFEDREENLGAQMLREAAERTGDIVGDGTSTATILAHAIFADGLRSLAAGASGVDLKRGLDRGLKAAVANLKSQSRPVKSHKEKVQVATISAHNDPAMGNLVADAMEKVGGDGVVSVEEAKGTETALEVVGGMQFDRGFLSPYFITDPSKMETVLIDPLILLYEKKISIATDLVPLLEEVAKAHRSILLVADEIDGEALATLVVNKLRGTLDVCAVKSPGYGDRRKAMMEDLAILTGGRFIAEELGAKLEKTTLDQLGTAQRVIIDKDNTTIVGGGGKKAAVQGRCAEIRQQIEKTTSDYDREKLQERLAKLSGGVAMVRVGAPSEAEMKNRKEALEDAISATKAAMAEGIVPGGGLALLRAADALAAVESETVGDERTGVHILRKAMEYPARQIAENSAADAGVVVGRMREGNANFGFDAATGQWVDLIEAGIIDAVKVVRVALENAVSVASVLLLTEATLTEVPDEKPNRLGESALAE